MDLIKLLQQGNSTLWKAIQNRHSERSYFPKSMLDPMKRNQLIEYSKTLNIGPFGTKIAISYTEKKMGTYYFISSGSTEPETPYFFIGAICTNFAEDKGIFDFGYLFEKLILYAAHLDIGTCWICGTYHAKEAEQYMKLANTPFKVMAISPFGKCKKWNEMGFFGKIKEKIFSSRFKRIPCSRLFFLNDFHTPLDPIKGFPKSLLNFFVIVKIDQKIDEKKVEKIEEKKEEKKAENEWANQQLQSIMECCRWAPTAKNQQGWRILYLENEKAFLFFSEIRFGNFYKKVDMGIIMAHFELAAIEYGLSGYWDLNNAKKFSTEKFRELNILLPGAAQFHFAWVLDFPRITEEIEQKKESIEKEKKILVKI